MCAIELLAEFPDRRITRIAHQRHDPGDFSADIHIRAYGGPLKQGRLCVIVELAPVADWYSHRSGQHLFDG